MVGNVPEIRRLDILSRIGCTPHRRHQKPRTALNLRRRMAEKRRIKHRNVLDLQNRIIVIDILSRCVIADLARINLPQRRFPLADIAGRIRRIAHLFVIVGLFDKRIRPYPRFITHNHFNLIDVRPFHPLRKRNPVGIKHAAVSFGQNRIAFRHDNIFFLVIPQPVADQFHISAGNDNIADCRNHGIGFVRLHLVG